MSKLIYKLIKFGKKEHIEDLLNNGTVYCNTIEYFRTLEEEEEEGNLRADNYEGTYRVTQFQSNTKIEIVPPGSPKKVLQFKNVKPLHLQEHYTNMNGNLYCLYSINSEDVKPDEPFRIDLRNNKFGTHFLLIDDPDKFLDLLFKKLKSGDYLYDTGFVNYYDKRKINREVGPFEKPREFEHQKEFRVLIENKDPKPIILKLGNLREIARAYENDHLHGSFTLNTKTHHQ